MGQEHENTGTIKELSTYIKSFLDARFPEGLDGQMLQIMTEIVFDAFRDGAVWQEQQTERNQLQDKLSGDFQKEVYRLTAK